MNEETGGFSKELASLIIKIREKYQAPEIEAQVVLFVTSNDLKSNQKAMLHCLEEFIKHENGIDGSNVKSHLEALLNRICNAEKLDNTSPEETKVSLQNLGSIMTKAELQTPHIVHTEKPKPEIIKRKKEKCRKCGELQILELLEKGICVFCKPAVLTKCIGCGRTVGKNLLNKETGTCVHC